MANARPFKINVPGSNDVYFYPSDALPPRQAATSPGEDLFNYLYTGRNGRPLLDATFEKPNDKEDVYLATKVDFSTKNDIRQPSDD